MRVVLDTNVYLSAILFGGTAEKVLERISQRGDFIFISPFIRDEIARVLAAKFRWGERKIAVVLDDLDEKTILVRPAVRLAVIAEKDDDNRILECAVAVEADYLISGDRKHILPLRNFRGTEVVSLSEFL